MAMTQKQWLIILAGLVVVAAAWMYYKKNLAKKPEAIDGPALEPAPVSEVEAANDKFPLKQGSKGKRVEQLQQFLQSRKGAKFPKFGIDGIFQQETLENVQKHLGVAEVSEQIFKTNRISDFKTFVFKG